MDRSRSSSRRKMFGEITEDKEVTSEDIRIAMHSTANSRDLDVSSLTMFDRQSLLEKLVKDVESDNVNFLKMLRQRIDSVRIDLPTVEVRFENLSVNAKCYVGDRALPTLWNATRNNIEMLLPIFGISTTERKILKDLSGIIKPGRMTLLLGPPSSGKTTVLKALSGKIDSDLKMKGKITYNGHALHEFVPQKTSAYVSQNDLHSGEMTVRETLEFSAICQGAGTRYGLLSELSKREEQLGILPDSDVDIFMKAVSNAEAHGRMITDYILKVLGLDICADTLVGDDMRRGISGGQKKRLTTGELIVGPTNTLFMDEISTGLDSSTTFQIVKSLQEYSHIFEATILMSLLQPAPETFNLFDDIMLLSEGHLVYLGPRVCVLDFFKSCGFKCPERKGAGDFLQEVLSHKDQEQYWADLGKPYRYVSAMSFSEKFKESGLGQQLERELAHPYNKEKSHGTALVFTKYSADKSQLLKANFAREWLLVKRNSFIYIFKTIQILIIAFTSMTVFIRTKMHHRTATDANIYLGSLFFTLIIIMFHGFSEIAMTIARLPVFYKQRDLLFYPAWAFSLPIVLLRLPMSLFESGIWTLMTYYVTGYTPEATRFFRHFFVLFWLHQMASGLFRLIAGLCRSMIIANTGGALALLIFFILGGFIIPRQDVPVWWIWGYWLSPLTYAENAISGNELLAPRWNNGSDSGLGHSMLLAHGFHTKSYWYWIGCAALFGFAVVFNIAYTFSLAYLNPVGKPQVVISKEELLAESEAVERVIVPFSVRRNLKKSPLLETPRGMILPFEPLAMCFTDVNYYVDTPTESKLQLLRGITGSFRPGVLTTLMGVSGAGKTTLMDVLAGRKTGGYIEGRICISGFPKNQQTFARVSGYCEQTDIHSPQITVYESLLFSAWLRLSPDVKPSDKLNFVKEVMELVELESIKNCIVGIPGVTGLSTEQRKRLTIAVELVANPSIIFMDEPTSGLDARAAAIVMRTLRNIVNTGRTIVCTIHQPSIDIFEAFDELMLMKRGGQLIYAGSLGRGSCHLINYFEAIPGVPAIKSDYNPATWMLEVTSVSAEQRMKLDFADIYNNSSLCMNNRNLVEQLSKPREGAGDLHFERQYSQSIYRQFTCCIWKQYWTYWRSPEYNCVRLFFTLVAGILFGSIFWNVGQHRGKQSDLFKVMGAMYGAVIFLGVNNCSTVQPVVATERTVFYRERAAGMYAALPYAMAQVLIEVPYLIIQSVMYALVTYSMIGFEWTAPKFFWYLFTMLLTFMYFTYYGMLAVSITPNHQVAAILASSFYALFNLFSGFLIPRPRIPKWWVWYYWICPVAWTVYGIITSQYGEVNEEVESGGGVTVKEYLKDYFGFEYEFMGVVAAVLVSFSVFFAFMFVFCIKFLNFQQR